MDDGMRDLPIAGTGLRYLDSANWALAGSGPGGAQLTGVSVPGDVITALQAAGVVGDPWFENNFRNATAWDRDWTYTVRFDDDGSAAAGGAGGGARLLSFDGVKMGAVVSLNGKELGTADDQFLRYVYDVTAVLKSTGNTLTVAFSRAIDTHGRFMGCSSRRRSAAILLHPLSTCSRCFNRDEEGVSAK